MAFTSYLKYIYILDFYKFIMTQLTVTEKIDNFRINFFQEYGKEMKNFFQNNQDKANEFMSAVIYCIKKCPNLMNDVNGLSHAIIDLAQIWLIPWITGEAYILPYKWKATPMIWYQWYVKLMYEAGVKNIRAEIVYEKDFFNISLWSDAKISHSIDPSLSKKARGKMIWCYVVVWANFKYMNIDDIYEFRNKYSTSYKNDLLELKKDEKAKKYSPWWEENDIEGNMPKKTVFKQMLKYIPKSKVVAKAVEIDNYEAPFNEPKKIITWWTEEQKKLDAIFQNLEPNPTENDSNKPNE